MISAPSGFRRAVATVATVALVAVASGEAAHAVIPAHPLGSLAPVLAMLIALRPGFSSTAPEAVQGPGKTGVASPLGADAGGK